MKKNGFTLIELLAVLIVLAIIGTITTTKVFNTLNTTKVKLCKNIMSDIKEATKAWAGDNIYMLPTNLFVDEEIVETSDTINSGDYNEEYNTLVINLKMLQDNGYIDSDIKNPLVNDDDEVDSRIIKPNLEIQIVYKNNNYDYIIPDENLLCSGDNR